MPEGTAATARITLQAVRVAYFSAEGKTLQEETFTDPAWPAGVKGIFLARGSKFREKWGRSLED